MSEFPISPPYEEAELKRPEIETRSLLRRLGRVAAAGLIAVTGIINLYGDEVKTDKLELFHEDNEQTVNESITIMTANVHSWKGEDGDNFDKFKRVVEKEEPDVICMQEVLSEGGKLEEIHDLGYDVFFHTTRDFPLISSQGNAVATRSPMYDISTVKLPSSRTYIPRTAIRFTVETNYKDLAFTNLHLDTESSGSDDQIKFINLKYGRTNDFACGDYNKTREAILAGPMGTMVDDNPKFASYNTFPSIEPVRQIDHILTYCGVQLSSEVLDIGSDHRALLETHYILDC